MKPVILCDVDGVLVDWFSRLPYFMEQKGMPTERAIQMYAHGHWQSVEDLTGLPRENALALCDEYSKSKYMKYLTPYKDALMAVNHLKKWYDFVAITAISNDPMAHKYRSENLEFWFPGAFKTVHCVGAEGSKYEILAKYSPTIWIEDSPNYAHQGILAGHQAIRIVRDSRIDTHPYLLANDWQEVSNLIQLLKPIGLESPNRNIIPSFKG